MIDTVGLAEHRLTDVRTILHRLTVSPNFLILHDRDLIGSDRLSDRHWNICRALATPANSMLLANESAYTAIWKEIHNQPMILVGNLHEDWNTVGTRYALSHQLVLSALNEDGLWMPITTFTKQLSDLLPEADRPSYSVESHFSTSISDALRWMGVAVEHRDHGPAPGAPLTIRDKEVRLTRGDENTFDVSAFGGTTPYVFTVESQSTVGLFSILNETLTINVPSLRLATGTDHSAVVKVTDANMRTDTATYSLFSSL